MDIDLLTPPPVQPKPKENRFLIFMRRLILFGFSFIALVVVIALIAMPADNENSSTKTPTTASTSIAAPPKPVVDRVTATIARVKDSSYDASITAEELSPIFGWASKHTNVQREDTEKRIKGKTVQWTLTVYEITREEEDGSEWSITTAGLEQVATQITLFTRNDKEKEYLAKRLQTGDSITIKGVIHGISRPGVVIDPAVLVLE